MKRLFVVLALAQLIPIWSVHYLPTTDGPSHLYNAWVFRELVVHPSDDMAKAFRIDWRPHPNWMTTVGLAALMSVAPPLVAEKIWLSAIVLLFAAAMWMYAGQTGMSGPHIGLLFTFNWLLQMGFYNHMLGVGVAFIAIAMWRRGRTAIVAVLFVVCYFCSPMMVLFAMGAVGLLWLTSSRDPRQLLAFVPVLPLVIWYASVSARAPMGPWPPLSKSLAFLLRARILYTFDKGQTIVGMIVLLIIIVSAVRARGVFVALTAIMLVLYFVAPDTFGGGFFVRQRIALLLFLTALAWIRLPKPRWIAIVIAAIVVANTTYLTVRFRQCSAMMEHAVRALDRAQTGQIVRTIASGKQPRGSNLLLMWHVVDYAAIERELVDAGNYEAATGYFPIAFRAGAERARADYVFTAQ